MYCCEMTSTTMTRLKTIIQPLCRCEKINDTPLPEPNECSFLNGQGDDHIRELNQSFTEYCTRMNALTGLNFTLNNHDLEQNMAALLQLVNDCDLLSALERQTFKKVLLLDLDVAKVLCLTVFRLPENFRQQFLFLFCAILEQSIRYPITTLNFYQFEPLVSDRFTNQMGYILTQLTNYHPPVAAHLKDQAQNVARTYINQCIIPIMSIVHGFADAYPPNNLDNPTMFLH